MKKLLFVTLIALLLALPLPVLAAAQDGGGAALSGAMPLLGGDEPPISPDDAGLGMQAKNAVDTADILALLDRMAATCKYSGKSYKGSSYEWLIMDMAAYAGLPNAAPANFTTAAARQAYIDHAINEAATATGGEKGGVYAKALLGLRALGINPADITTVNKTKLNIINLLKATTTQNIYNAAYMLMAYKQGSYSSAAQENTLIAFLLAEQLKSANGAWLDSWSGLPDPDSTAMALQALAAYKDRPEVAAAIAGGLAYLSGIQEDNGAINSIWTGEPSAASTAQVILALVALGLDADAEDDFIKNDGEKDNSLLAGLLGLQNAANDYFGVDWAGNDDEFSTEQAFCALIAVAQQRQLEGAACHPYYFTHLPSAPGVATSTGGATQPNDPPDTNQDIKVYFTLKGPDSIWIDKAAVTVKAGSKVYHVITKGLAAQGYKQAGADSGYIKSITRPNGQTLAEFDQGPDSGWLYKVNGYLPNIGITAYEVAHGDQVLLYYTGDWGVDPDAGKFSGNSPGQVAAAIEEVSVPTVAAEENPPLEVSFSDVPENHWAAKYIYSLAERGVIKGKTPALFAPQDSLSRAELTALLCRLSGEEPPQAAPHFTDVPETAWYAKELAWAVEAGIIKGVGENRFAPQLAVSRQDMALMLLRYAAYLGLDLPAAEPAHAFSDAAAVSAYAREAVAALQAAGLTGGYEDNSFRPQNKISRAEAAKLLFLIDEI